MTNLFEKFLQERHGEQCTLPGDMWVEDFEKFISELDINQWLNYGEWFGNLREKEVVEKQVIKLAKRISDLEKALKEIEEGCDDNSFVYNTAYKVLKGDNIPLAEPKKG